MVEGELSVEEISMEGVLERKIMVEIPGRSLLDPIQGKIGVKLIDRNLSGREGGHRGLVIWREERRLGDLNRGMGLEGRRAGWS